MTLSFDTDKTHAILIGASEFEQTDDLLLPLPAVPKNLDALKQWLKGIGLPDTQITPLLNPSNGADITLKLDKIVKEAKKGRINTLIFYYAGHGIPDKNQELYLATRQTDRSSFDNGGALAFNKVQNMLTDLEKVTLIFILDCCYSGKAIKGFRRGSQSVYFLTATPANYLADAPEGETYTAFTGELITVLIQGVENHGETLSLADIHKHLKIRLTPDHPEPQRQPWNEEPFVFAFNRAYSTIVNPTDSLSSVLEITNKNIPDDTQREVITTTKLDEESLKNFFADIGSESRKKGIMSEELNEESLKKNSADDIDSEFRKKGIMSEKKEQQELFVTNQKSIKNPPARRQLGPSKKIRGQGESKLFKEMVGEKQLPNNDGKTEEFIRELSKSIRKYLSALSTGELVQHLYSCLSDNPNTMARFIINISKFQR